MWARLATKGNLLLAAALVVAAAIGVTLCYFILRKVPGEADARAVVEKKIQGYSHGMVRLLSFQKTTSSSDKFNTFGYTGLRHTILYTADIEFTGESAWNRKSWFIAGGPPQPRSKDDWSTFDDPPDEHIGAGEHYRVTGMVTFVEDLEHPPGQWRTDGKISKAERIGAAPAPLPIASATPRPAILTPPVTATPTPVPENAAIELTAINVFPKNDRLSGSGMGFLNVSDRGIKAFRGAWQELDDFGEITRSGAFAYTSELSYIDERGSDFPATGHIVAPGEVVYLMDVVVDGQQRQYAMSREAGKKMSVMFLLPTIFNGSTPKLKYRATVEKVIFATPDELQGALAQRAARPSAAVAEEKPTPPLPPAASSPVETDRMEPWMRWLRSYLAACDQNDPEAQGRFFADTFDLFDEGHVDRKQFIKDLRAYQRLWPERKTVLLGEPVFKAIPGREQCEVRFSSRFEAKNSEHYNRGKVDTVIIASTEEDMPQVISLKQAVSEQAKGTIPQGALPAAPVRRSESAADEPARQRYTIVGVARGDSLNVHSGPAMKSSTVFTLTNGDAVQSDGSTVFNGNTEWCPIVCTSGTGWVSRKYLEPER